MLTLAAEIIYNNVHDSALKNAMRATKSPAEALESEAQLTTAMKVVADALDELGANPAISMKQPDEGESNTKECPSKQLFAIAMDLGCGTETPNTKVMMKISAMSAEAKDLLSKYEKKSDGTRRSRN